MKLGFNDLSFNVTPMAFSSYNAMDLTSLPEPDSLLSVSTFMFFFASHVLDWGKCYLYYGKNRGTFA